MEARAVVRDIRISPRKMRIVANMVRGEQVERALAVLRVLPKRSAGVIAKALVSASANAEDRGGGEVDVDNLVIKSITVDNGKILKRWMPRAMGRANRIQHRTSHLVVVVGD